MNPRPEGFGSLPETGDDAFEHAWCISTTGGGRQIAGRHSTEAECVAISSVDGTGSHYGLADADPTWEPSQAGAHRTNVAGVALRLIGPAGDAEVDDPRCLRVEARCGGRQVEQSRRGSEGRVDARRSRAAAGHEAVV